MTALSFNPRAYPAKVNLAILFLCLGWAMHFLFYFTYLSDQFPPRTTYLQLGVGIGLERLLAEWNVDVGDNLVMDRAQGRADAARVLITSEFGGHPVVNPIRDARLALVMPRSVRQRVACARSCAGFLTNAPGPFGRAIVRLAAPA